MNNNFVHKVSAMRFPIILCLILFVKFLQAQNSITILRIDPDQANGGTSSRVFKTLKFIPLETSKESLFGKIYQLEITDKHFIILDKETKAILFFKRDGQFEFKIKPKSPDLWFGYFTIDRKNNLLITKSSSRVFLIYDLNGNLLKRIKIPFDCYSIFCFQNSTLLYNTNRSGTPAVDDIIKYDLHYAKDYTQPIKAVLPYDAKNEIYEFNVFTNTMSHISGGNTVTFSLPCDYNVYELNDTGMIHQYKFVFPSKYSIPEDFSTSAKYTGKKRTYFKNNGMYTIISTIENVYHLEDHILFTTRIAANTKNYIYNLKTGNLTSFDKIAGDSSSFYIQVLSDLNGNLNGVYKNHIFSSVPAVYMFEVNKEKPAKYNAVLDNFFETSNKHSNPVIIETELQDGI